MYAEILEKIGPLRDEVSQLESKASTTQLKVTEMNKIVDDLENSIQVYKDEYAILIRDTQSLKTEMDLVRVVLITPNLCSLDHSKSRTLGHADRQSFPGAESMGSNQPHFWPTNGDAGG